jgi:perosamine synthetase
VTGRRVKAIIPVHILGHPVDMTPVLDVARKFGLTVIEDATESLGSKYKEKPVGQLGAMACFSFNGNKLLTTGGGGMLVTNDPELARRARYLTTQAKDDPIEYVHNEVGYNYRLTNIQAAMGVAQMEQLGAYVEAKRRIAATYADALREVPGLTIVPEARWAWSTFWMYTILVDPDAFGMGSRDLLKTLDQARIQTRPLWQPLHQSRAHEGAFATDCSTAEHLHHRALSLPCSVGLSPESQARVIDEVTRVAARSVG